MSKVIFVTSNPGKAKYFSKLIGMEIEHHAVDVDEIQSLDMEEVAIHKVKQAYQHLKRPVLIDDTSLTINSLGKLPGPFIKWFEKSLGLDGICRLVDFTDDRSARASNIYAYYDGQSVKLFKGALDGTVAQQPKGDPEFGFNSIFIPGGQPQTLAEMDEEVFIEYYLKIKPIKEVGKFLAALDKDKA